MNVLPHQLTEVAWRREKHSSKVYLQTVLSPMSLELELSYNLGGYSYVASKTFKRGYSLHIMPCRISIRDGIVVSSLKTAHQGYRHLIKEVTRFSASTLRHLENAQGMREIQRNRHLWSPLVISMIKLVVGDGTFPIYEDEAAVTKGIG